MSSVHADHRILLYSQPVCKQSSGRSLAVFMTSTESQERIDQGKLYTALRTTEEQDGVGRVFEEDDFSSMYLREDTKGLRITSGHVTLDKDPQNLVGISIGGGAPHCPCLYVVQIFDNTPASRDGTLASGDEIVGVNGESVKGRSKMDVARIIQSHKDKVVIMFNKLHADPKQGRTLDIVLKKMKHRVVEGMSSSTADALGLSRAILVNDSLVKKLDEMHDTSALFHNLVIYVRKLVRGIFDLAQAHKAFGEVFGQVGCKEPQPRASQAFTDFATSHRAMEKFAVDCLHAVRPIVDDISTFTKKVVPDMKLTVQKYLDSKFEYLSYCLKVKEMDDEEYSFSALNEPLYRVESGNYEYRLILRCRQEARMRFAQLRNDVMEKLELLDNKHVQDVVNQLQRFVQALSTYYQNSYKSLKEAQIFPIELDLNYPTFQTAEQELCERDETSSGHYQNTEYDSGVKMYQDEGMSSSASASGVSRDARGYQLLPLLDTNDDHLLTDTSIAFPADGDDPLLVLDRHQEKNSYTSRVASDQQGEDVALLDCFIPPPELHRQQIFPTSGIQGVNHTQGHHNQPQQETSQTYDVDLLTDL